MKKVLLFVLAAAFVPVAISAASVLPDEIKNIFDLLGPQGTGTSGYVISRIQLALLLGLGAIVLASVAYALMAAFKYIRSEGDSGKMEEAQKSIKAIFFGIAAMLIAIVGIVLVFVIFGSNPINPSVYQTCLQAAESWGCKLCKDGGEDNASCKLCEDKYKELQQPEWKGKTRDEILDVFKANDDLKKCINPIDGGALIPTTTPTP